jgi:hypothetical protein
MNSIRLFKKISSLNTSIIRGEEILSDMFCQAHNNWKKYNDFQKLEYNIVYESLHHTVEMQKTKKKNYKKQLINKLKQYEK